MRLAEVGATVAHGFSPEFSDHVTRDAAAMTKLERALAAAKTADDAAAEAEALRGIGTLLYKQARYAEARDKLLSAVPLYEALGDHDGIGWTLHYLGQVAYLHETGEAADNYWTRGLAEMETAHDRRGAELMPAFYRSWRRGHNKSVALRDAQLQLLGRLRAGRVLLPTQGGALALPDHPFFWAGFVLLGEA